MSHESPQRLIEELAAFRDRGWRETLDWISTRGEWVIEVLLDIEESKLSVPWADEIDQRDTYDLMTACLTAAGEAHFEAFLEAINRRSLTGNSSVIWAIRNMKQIPSERVRGFLVDALRETSGPVRWCAAMALAEHGGEDETEPLIAALKDDSVRSAAMEALGRVGDQRAIEPLEAVASKPKRKRRFPAESEMALEALERIRTRYA